MGKKRAPHSQETKVKMSLSATGKKKTEEHKRSISIAKTGCSTRPHSDETKKKISESVKKSLKGKDRPIYQTAKYREVQSTNMKRIWKERKEVLNRA